MCPYYYFLYNNPLKKICNEKTNNVKCAVRISFKIRLKSINQDDILSWLRN